MANYSRRGILGLFMGGAIATALPAVAYGETLEPSAQVQAGPSPQVQTALDYLKTNQPGQAQLILDKVNSQIYLVNERGAYDVISVIHGRTRADDLVAGGSDDITPAGRGGIEVSYDPSLSKNYIGGITLDFLKGKSTKLSIHSELGMENKDTPGKSSNGCIRIPRKKFDYLIGFVLRAEQGGDVSYAMDAKAQIDLARNQGRQLDEPIKTAIELYVLPEVDTSPENTIRSMQKQFGCSLDTFAKGPEFCPAAG